ncbi:MAG: hypothetical protein OXQ31_01105 [Spirochaetaceae bacterium]|nr:hypothetical protein [Spirochaetaceae bacterium]
MTQAVALTGTWQRVTLIADVAYSLQAEYPLPAVLLRLAADEPAADERAVFRLGLRETATVKVSASEALWARIIPAPGASGSENLLVYDECP